MRRELTTFRHNVIRLIFQSPFSDDEAVWVAISDEWRGQMQIDLVADFMREHRCRFKMQDDTLYLLVPNLETAAMARLAL